MLFLFTVSSLQAFSLFLGVSSLIALAFVILWAISDVSDMLSSGIGVWFVLTLVLTSMFSIAYFSIKLVLFGLGVI